MDWKGIVKKKGQPSYKSTGRKRQWKIALHNRSRLVISYIKNNATKSHVFIIPKILNHLEKHKYVVAGFVLLISGAFIISSVPANKAKNITSTGIGGGGTGQNEATTREDQDEVLKDQLLQQIEAESEIVEGSEEIPTLFKREYIVQKGDTLSAIASISKVSVESIAGSSGIQILDHLRVGQKLSIPNKEGFFYSIKKNERLAQVLTKYTVGYDKFLEENPGINTDLLEVGQEVFLPGAKPKNIIRSWLFPVSSRIVTSRYGPRRYPRRAFHKGLDLKANYTSVRAAKGGRVVYAGRLGGYGNVVIISHPGGYKTLYGHLSKIYVRKGSRVVQGTVIAKSGNTGYSTGPHLHFEVTRNGKHINPAIILTGLRYRKRRR
ncbi:MAG: peptidoglycan DD-metalloendopeptidase family protein [Leptospirales bacterium]